MKNKFTSIFVICLGFLAVRLNAQERLSVTYGSAVKSRYVGGQTAIRIHDGPVSQNSITVSRKGTYAFLWSSSPLDTKWNSDYGTELDFGVGHDFAISPDWRLDIGFAYYNLMPLETTRGDLDGFYVTAYAVRGAIYPFMRIEQDFARNSSVLPGGLTYKVGVSIPTARNAQVQLTLFGHGRAYGKQAEMLSAVQLGLSTDCKVGSSSIKAGVTLQKALGRGAEHGGFAHDEVIFWVSSSF